MNFTSNASKDEKVQSLLRERRMLEQRLEEAHLHLSDIKGTWSAQNMALETQVDRLSRQVAAETTEKRKALKSHDEMAEKMKQTTFQLEKANSEIDERNQKVKCPFSCIEFQSQPTPTEPIQTKTKKPKKILKFADKTIGRRNR